MRHLFLLLVFIFGVLPAKAEESLSSSSPSQDPLVFQEHGLMGFLARDGQIIAEPQFQMAYAFTEGLAAVQLAPTETLYSPSEQRGLWGFIGRDGEFAIPANFSQAYPFQGNGYAYVSTLNKKAAWVSKTGELKTTPQFPTTTTIGSEDVLLPTEGEEDLYGFMNTNEEMVIPAKFSEVGEFSENLAPVQEGQTWGFIDKQGSYVIPSQFEYASSFHQGKALAKTREGYTIIGKDGKSTIGKYFPKMEDFSGNRAATKDAATGLWGYLDENGEWAIPAQYESAETFLHELAQVCKKGFCGLLDRSGTLVLPLRFSYVSTPEPEIIAAKFATSDYFFTRSGAMFHSPLRLRNFLLFLLYTGPLVLPFVVARLLVRRRIPLLLSMQGEEFRALSFRTSREIARIRFLHTIAFLLLLIFTKAYVYLGWYLAEVGARGASLLAYLLELKNPVTHPCVVLIWFQALSGLVLLLGLLFVGGAGIRGSWIRIEQEVFHSKLTAKRYYRSVFRAQFAAFFPLVILVALTMRYETVAHLGYGVTILYFFLLAVLSPLLLRLSNRTITKTDEQLEGLSKELQEKSGIKVRQMQIIDEPTGRISNAFAAGLLPRYRRVYVTKNLLEKSSTEELKAILAHEFGHFKHHDVAKRLALALALLWPLQKGLEFLASCLPIPEENFGISLLLWFLIGVPIITLVVGWRARKAEYAADRYAAELVGDPEIVIQALQKIHEHSAIPSRFGRIHRYFLGHPSLEERTQALVELKRDNLAIQAPN